jgi:hypothetical protein
MWLLREKKETGRETVVCSGGKDNQVGSLDDARRCEVALEEGGGMGS